MNTTTPSPRVWNYAMLTRSSIETEASYQLGDEMLSVLQDKIEDDVGAALYSLTEELKAKYPMLKVRYSTR